MGRLRSTYRWPELTRQTGTVGRLPSEIVTVNKTWTPRPELRAVQDDVGKMDNVIKSKVLNTRLCCLLCEEFEAY